MSIKKPDLVDLHESIQVFFYSAWAILYYDVVWINKNFHRFIHIIWLLTFCHIYGNTLKVIWMWIGVPPAIIYAILWTVWLRRIFDGADSD